MFSASYFGNRFFGGRYWGHVGAVVVVVAAATTPAASNDIRLLIGDTTGRLLAELTAGIGDVSWRLNEIGKVPITISRRDEKATADFLRFGNLVLLQFGNGLPDWGGVIDPPRQWRPNGTIQATAYSGEYLLKLRRTSKGRYFDQATPGYIFESVINEANALAPIGIILGSVGGGSTQHSPEYHFKDLFWILQESICRNLTDYDFDVTPAVENGRIVFHANLYERKGRTLDNVALIEGHNLVNVELIEQGPILNAWNVVGDGVGWGDERPVSYRDDPESINLYGLREGAEISTGIVNATTLDTAAETRLRENKNPRNRWDLTAVDMAPATFRDYDIGDVVRLLAPSCGFGGTDTAVRVLERSFNQATGLCRLIVEENYK